VVRREVGEWEDLPPELPTRFGSVIEITFTTGAKRVAILCASGRFSNVEWRLDDGSRIGFVPTDFTILFDAGASA
jgi:hypothetical protein